MTQKEKAKAYDIALDKIKRLLGTGSNCSREDLEHVFPELMESEDERIRKEIIAHIKWCEDGGYCAKEEMTRWISWLEKQGETSPILSSSSNIGKVDQNTWSEEDNKISTAIYESIDTSILNDFGVSAHEAAIWLKSLRPQSHWKPSKEQMAAFEAMLTVSPQSSAITSALIELYEQMKKLREE